MDLSQDTYDVKLEATVEIIDLFIDGCVRDSIDMDTILSIKPC